MGMNGKFDLILFDCDGVLVDSEHVAHRVFTRILNEECGLTLTLTDMYDPFVGQSFAQCIKIVERMIGRSVPTSIERRYKAEVRHALATEVTAVPGVERVLRQLRTPYCVASNSSYETMRLTLGKSQLMPLVEGKLHSASDVERGKPYPDIYRHAASRMGIEDPSKCLVIEDSPLGVQAGVAADMTVYGYSGRTDANKLMAAGAVLTFRTMEQLLGKL